jgi:D-tyrosyl-tRNA(Tyr) deacylase
MRAVVQRALGASVVVEGAVVGAFEGPGLVVLVGATHGDTADDAEKLAVKVHELRIFGPEHAAAPLEDGRRELSAAELGLPLLVISQFTLYGDTRKGRRPSWTAAAPGPVAEPLVDHVVAVLRERGATVGTGVFGADMKVSFTNDGPITVLVEVGA